MAPIRASPRSDEGNAVLREIYLSPLGVLISWAMNAISFIHQPFMVYGYRDKPSGKFRKRTRISSSAILSDKGKIAVGDNVWIWHHAIIDGSNGVTIGDGAQIGAGVGIFSHGSQVAVRLYGERYIEVDKDERKGYTRGPVSIGPFCFVGAGAMILPGASLGKGCLVATGAVVSSQVPDHSIVRGSPGKVVGDVRSLDAKFMDDPELKAMYFDPKGMADWLAQAKGTEAAPVPT